MRDLNVYLFSDVKIVLNDSNAFIFTFYFDQVGKAEDCFKFVVVYEE